jgi:hypothetical protein
MKAMRSKVFIIGIAVVALVAWLVRMKTPRGPAPTLPTLVVQTINIATNETTQVNRFHEVPKNLLNVKRAGAFTDEEKKELAGIFKRKLRPAAEKWFLAYSNHVPFNLADLTLDKFAERIGKDSSYRLYTFVLGDITFTIQETKDGAKVDYLMSRKAAVAMNDIPAPGTVPNLSVPVNRSDIIGMVQADSGVQFKLNEVIIRPTAAACGINGGAFVHTVPAGADPNNSLSSKVDMVFDSDGKLVNYDRDPFF